MTINLGHMQSTTDNNNLKNKLSSNRRTPRRWKLCSNPTSRLTWQDTETEEMQPTNAASF